MDGKRYQNGHYIGMGLALGLPIGLPIGLVLGNFALGPAIGAALGVIIGLILERIFNNDPLPEDDGSGNRKKVFLFITTSAGVVFLVVSMIFLLAQ